MILISFGIPKSGSTALFNICWQAVRSDISKSGRFKEAVRVAEVDSALPADASGFISNKEDLAKIVGHILDKHDSPERLIFIKSHHACQKNLRPLLNDERVFAIGSFRHPADVALSLVDASHRDRERGVERFGYFDLDAAAKVLPWFEKMYASLFEDATCVPVYYDWIGKAPEVILRTVCEKLQLSPDMSEVMSYFRSDKLRYGEYNKGVIRRRSVELDPKQIVDLSFRAPRMAGASLLYESKFDCSDFVTEDRL